MRTGDSGTGGECPWSQTVVPFTVIVAFGPEAGTAMVPLVPSGAVTSISNSPPLALPHLTVSGPCGVGTCPSAQLSDPGCGWTIQVAYPAPTGRAPST